MSDVQWHWEDFSYAPSKSGMDSRRAAFWLYDFINLFGISTFHIISSTGEFNTQSITIVYSMPNGLDENKVYEKWKDYRNKWKESH